VPESIYGLRDRDLIALAMLGLLGLGTLMVQSAAVNVTTTGAAVGLLDWTGRGSRHALYVALAVLTFLISSRLDYRRLAGSTAVTSPAVWFTILAAMLCIAALLPGVGAEVNGARRWLKIGPLTLQPSELAKWATVLFLAWRLSRPGTFTFVGGFVASSAIVGLLCLLVVIQDFGTAALIGTAAGLMLFAGPVKLRWLLAAIGPAAAAAVYFVWTEPYRMRRITAFLDPWANPETDGYHVIQSLYSFAGGGWTGRGLGNGVQKLGYLPEDTTDFIFAVVSEELGLAGGMLVALAYLTILIAGLLVARKCPDPMGRLLVFGTVTTIGLQAAINIAVATASVPTKGIALPLVSAGGTGLVCVAFMLGLVHSVARNAPVAGEDGEWETLLRGKPSKGEATASKEGGGENELDDDQA
jgi:cell division protein FtsW